MVLRRDEQEDGKGDLHAGCPRKRPHEPRQDIEARQCEYQVEHGRPWIEEPTRTVGRVEVRSPRPGQGLGTEHSLSTQRICRAWCYHETFPKGGSAIRVGGDTRRRMGYDAEVGIRPKTLTVDPGGDREGVVTRWQPDPSFYPSPRLAEKAPPETLAYVAMFDPDRKQPDGIAVVDLDPGHRPMPRS